MCVVLITLVGELLNPDRLGEVVDALKYLKLDVTSSITDRTTSIRPVILTSTSTKSSTSAAPPEAILVVIGSHFLENAFISAFKQRRVFVKQKLT